MRHPWTLELPSLCRHWEAGRELEFFLFVPFGSFPEWHKASPYLRVPEDSAPSAETRVLYSSSWVQRTLTNAYGRVVKTKDMPCRKPNNPSFPAEWKFLMCIFRAALFWGPSVFGESWRLGDSRRLLLHIVICPEWLLHETKPCLTDDKKEICESAGALIALKQLSEVTRALRWPPHL